MKGLQEEAKPTTGWGEQPPGEGRPPIRHEPADSIESASLKDPRAYRAFVRSLLGRVEGRLATKLDRDVQVEIANLMRLLTVMPRKTVAANRVHFELAFDLLGAEQPNLLLVKSIRLELAAINDSAAYGISRLIGYISGDTALNAAISALISTFVLALGVLALLMTGHRAILQEMAGTAELFASLGDGSVALLIIAIHAAFIGGIVSVLARIQDFLSDPTLSPPIIYISVIRKPFLAATFVVLVFAVLKAGLVSFHGVDLAGPSAPYLAWALGFLCGFSERLAQDFAVSAGDRLGEADSVDVESSQKPPRTGD